MQVTSRHSIAVYLLPASFVGSTCIADDEVEKKPQFLDCSGTVEWVEHHPTGCDWRTLRHADALTDQRLGITKELRPLCFSKRVF